MTGPGSAREGVGKIPQPFIDELVSRIDIVDLIEGRVPLRKAGRNYLACCPFHNEKTPSFTVSPDKQFYHCFGCGAHGTAIGFLMAYDRMSFVEAVQELATRAGLELPSGTGIRRAEADPELRSLLAEVAEFYRQQLSQHPQALAYLKQRGVDRETAEVFQIGYAPPGWTGVLRAFGGDAARRAQLISAGLLIEKAPGSLYDRFRDRLMFPIHDHRGQVVGFGGRVLDEGTPKYLNSPETPAFQKGRILYGRYQARQALPRMERVLVVEGYMDVVALAQHGIRYAVATLGTSTTGEHAVQLQRMAPEVVFCFDGDDAGRQAAWRALENVLAKLHDGQQVRFMFLPQGEDPDSLVRKIGRDDLERLVLAATPLSGFFFDTLASKVDLSSLDGRARLVELARPYLSNLSPGVLHEMMIARLGDLANLPVQRLSRLLNGRAEVSPRAPAPELRRTGPSSVRRAITLLLHNPSLALIADAVDWLRDAAVPGAMILADMLDFLRQHPNKKTMGELLEHWRETEVGGHLDRLAQEPPLGLDDSPAAIQAEFLGALRQLKIQHVEQRIEALLAKSRASTLVAEESRELQRLFNEQQGLKRSLHSNNQPPTV